MRAAETRPLPTAAARHGAGECTRVCPSGVLPVAFASRERERRRRGGKRVGPGVSAGTEPSVSAVRPVGPEPARDSFSIGRRGRSLGLLVSPGPVVTRWPGSRSQCRWESHFNQSC